MDEGKQRTGFHTPAREIQDTFEKVRDELGKAKTDWNSLSALFGERIGVLMEYLNEIDKSLKERHDVNQLVVGAIISDAISASILGILMCHLGCSLAETQERVAKVEKAAGDLKLKLK